MIFGRNCKILMSKFFLKLDKKILMPSDMCANTIKEFNKKKINFDFYRIKRNFISKDEYLFSKNISKKIVIISDLFNFRLINFKQIKDTKIFLDLAHCSIDTAKYYIKRIKPKNILGICISFGRGKYYDFNGGGVLFDPNNIENLNIQPQKLSIKNLPKKVLNKGVFNKTSTQIILKKKYFTESEIHNYRKKGFDVSDGLFDHLDSVQNNERYFWKPRIKLY